MKIGIMGGTFDPLHNAHLFVAKELQHRYHLDKILFIPSKYGPHKKGSVQSSAELRFQMVAEAIADQADFVASDLELKREGISYSIDTVKLVKAQYPEAEVFFITGADAFLSIETWHQFRELLSLLTFLVATRPTRTDSQLYSEIERIKKAYHAKVELADILDLEISSSDIRKRVREARPITYLVPKSVEKSIEKYNLYQKEVN